jgi:hypothetical protein
MTLLEEFGSLVRSTNNDADSFYNGLQSSLNQRYRNSLSFGFAYT